jgi:hypothetical protein
MDPEIQRDYEEHMRTMVDLLNQQATATSKLLNSLQSTSKATDVVKSNTEATKKQTEVLSGSTKALEAGAVAQQKYAEAAANFSRGLISGQAAVISFGNAILSAEKSIGKYGNAFQSAGDAAWDIGKNFGVLGMVAGGLAKGFGAIAEGVFKSVDSVVQFRDETSRFAGILPTTISGIQELGSNARFSGDEIMKLSKTMSGFGTNILSLGGSAGENALKFMQMSAVTDDVRRKFGRLGVDQDRLNELQGMYIQMQGVSGKALENRTKTEGQLQRESLAYAKNLIIMSDLTGQTAEQMQQEREVVKAEFEEQVKIRQENIQIQRLRAAGEHEAADAIKKEQDNRTQLIQTMTDAYGRDIGSQFGRLARTGVYDQFTSGLATLGVSATEVSNIVKTSGNIQSDSLKQAQKVTDLQNNMVERVGDSFQFMGEESARALLGSTEAITKGNNYLGKNLEEEVEKSKKAAAAKEAEGDKMADAVEQIRSAEREIQKLYYDSMYALAEIVVPKFAGALEWATQKLLETVNWFQSNFNEIVKQIQKWGPVIATVVGSVVAVFASLKIGRGVVSIFSGIIGAGRGLINWMRRVTSTPMGGGADGPDVDGPDRRGRGGRGGRIGRGLLRLGKGLAGGLGGLLGGIALDYGADRAAEAGYTRTSAGLSVGSNALTGAGIGATVGSVIPGVGTAIGGAVGGLLGGAYGLYQNWDGLTGGNDPEKKAATEKQVTAATTNKTASEGMATASADFKNTVTELAKTNKESYEKIVSASTGGQTTEEIEKRKEATKESNDTLDKNTKNFANSTNQTTKDIEQRKILAKNSQEQMKQQTALFKTFTQVMDSAALMVTTLKDAMKGLVDQIGTSLTQLQGASVGGSANSLATVESMMAFNKALESGGGKHLRASKLGGAPTIGGAYGMGQAARSDAFTKYATDQERAELARLGFTSTPTLDQLVNKEGTAFLSPQAEQADELLARIHARGSIADVTRSLGRAPTNAEMRGAHHLGIAGFTKFQRELTANPNMTMESFIRNNPSMYPEDTNISQFGGRNLSEQNAFFGSEVDRVLGGPQQQRIRQLAMTLKNEGFNVSGHPDFNPTGGHMDGSLHDSGRALDINIDGQGPEWDDPRRRARFDALRDRLTAQGFEVIWGTEDHKDHLHIELAKGGIVSGPTSGYPATLHGTEVVTPLNMDSILMRLAKTPAAADGADGMLGSNVTREALDRMSLAQQEMIDVLTRKLDNMIDALDDGNSTRTRILRNSMV